MASPFDPHHLFRNWIPTRRAVPKIKPPLARRRQTLHFEALEPRQMMAADMAEIVGTIRLDLQGDGIAANDVAVAGAQVRLYRDGGDGVFNGGGGDDVAAKPAVSSSSLGQYRFAGLAAGKYFVKIDLPAGMQATPGGDVRAVTISAADADGAIGSTIDEFDTFQEVEASPPPNAAGVGSVVPDSSVLGGERDFLVEITGGSDPYSSVSLISAAGLLRLSSSAVVTGNAKIVWDGIDGNATAINATGLGGLDFTKDGPNTMTGIRLSVGADHDDSVVKLRIYSDATHWSEFTTTVPESLGGAIDQQVVFNFADPDATGSGGGADFTKVGAIELTFVGVSAVDAQISVAELVGLTTKTADFTVISDLSLGDRVWLDANNNGWHDGAEQGIAGVVVNLYADTDGNNQYTPSVDQFVATANTDSNGRYLFTGLPAGAYVVQVDGINFQAGRPLAGLLSSNGTTATDPDDNVDGDDNGTPLAGFGVVSAAINLLAGAEPTTDGDDANSNRTVDFGFFGFDLSLEKSVDLHAAAPLEELTYDILVVNQGPATAKNVQFTDTLPQAVTYLDSNVSKSGLTLTQNGGLVSGSLGDMAPGEQIIITIRVRIQASATGTLRNEAEVSAPDELNLLNNRDSEETIVTPTIDLAIVKSDGNVDEVEPGATITYTLQVTNHGPSNATGVRVSDALPSQVSVISTSATNVSGVAGQLEFNIGSLAAGASSTITVLVKVNDSFVGDLLNNADVTGDQVETNYLNNHDDEPTRVRANPASISGVVYVDKNKNGIYDGNDTPLAGVVIALTGNPTSGGFISREVTTNAAGQYSFTDLKPGTYMVLQPTQPAGYRDGLESLGNTFNRQGQPQAERGSIAPAPLAAGDRDGEAFEGITLAGGFAAMDYNFGELAVSPSKRNYIQPMVRRGS